MFSKEWRADFGGREIVVTNSWGFPLTTEARLYIDGAKVDESRAMFADASTPILRGVIASEGGVSHRVEVFMKSALLRVRVKICVDGEVVAGDSF